MKKSLNTARWISLFLGILLFALGFMFFANPKESLITLSTWIAFIFILAGVLRIIRYFTDGVFHTGSFLITSILDIVLGILMIASNPSTALALGTLISFWITFSSIAEIAISIDLKKVGVSTWWIGLLTGILGIILGISMIRDPLLSSIYIGSYIVLYGVTFITTFFGITSITKRF
ncbi:MAG TPA: DUF308 domain-containing protein [Tissierellaceae bacterium]|nr:DUF308 domain-containing protein [Tissierellaceae bacterium]